MKKYGVISPRHTPSVAPRRKGKLRQKTATAKVIRTTDIEDHPLTRLAQHVSR